MHLKSIYMFCTLVLLVIMLVGCHHMNTIMSPNLFTEQYLPLPEELEGKEWMILQDTLFSSPVNGLCYQEETNTLFVVFSEDGNLARWDLDSEKVVNNFHLGIQSVDALQFRQTCKEIIGSTQVENRNGQDRIPFEFIDDIRIWDTSTGEELECEGDCENTTINPLQTGMAKDSSGKNSINYYESMYSINGDSIHSVRFIRGSEETTPTIGKIIFIPDSARFIIAYLEGGISVHNSPIIARKWILRNHAEEKKEVAALITDPMGQLTARIQDNHLGVWRIDAIAGKEVLNIGLEGERIIVFDQTGQLIFVGGNGHIRIWDIEQKKMIHEIEADGITKMMISEDNRLLFWGDEWGRVHIWGVRQQVKYP